MEKEEKLLYEQAIKKWGESSQVNMAYEEMGELISALNKFQRGRIGIDGVITEIADVQIMVEQLSVMFGTESVSLEKARKLRRLKDRLKS